MATIGLYYPFIHFKDDDWLKVSALYWNRMARIVPHSYVKASEQVVLERDSEVTRQLIDRFGLRGEHTSHRGELSYQRVVRSATGPTR